MLHASGTTPRRANTKPTRAAVEAIRTSIGSVKVAPKPTAAPLMAAMIGFDMSKSRSVTTPPPSSCFSIDEARPRATASNVWPPAPRSAPAQKARPAPVTMRARTASSPSAASSAATISRSIAPFTALSRSGRWSVRTAIPSSMA